MSEKGAGCSCPRPHAVKVLRQESQHIRLMIMEGNIASSAELHILSRHGREGETECPRCGETVRTVHRRKRSCPGGHILAVMGNALYVWDLGEPAEPHCPPEATEWERWKFREAMLLRRHDFVGLGRFYTDNPEPERDGEKR